MWWIALLRAVIAVVLGLAVLVSQRTKPGLGTSSGRLAARFGPQA
jgi:preprotein translocase subunit SecG